MNKDEQADDYRSLLLLDEISKNHELTQRDLSKNLGFALGLINAYLKNLIAKGYITVSAIPKKRYTYYLTPSGFAEKTRLTFQHLQNFTNLFRAARRDFHMLFNDLKNSKVKRVAFCGIDEITEIAYLSLKEAGLELGAILDADTGKKTFLGYEVHPLSDVGKIGSEAIIITCFLKADEIKQWLLNAGVPSEKIMSLSTEGWLKKQD